jgi:hypothetical protein
VFSALVVIGVIALAIWLLGGVGHFPAQLVEVARIIFFCCLIVIVILVVVSALGRPHFLGVWW